MTSDTTHTTIEVDLRPGIPSLTVVGAIDSLSEAVAGALRDRRRLPMQRVTINVRGPLPDVTMMRRAVEAKADAQATEGMPAGYTERPVFPSEHTCKPLSDRWLNYYDHVNKDSLIDASLRTIYADMACPACAAYQRTLKPADIEECREYLRRAPEVAAWAEHEHVIETGRNLEPETFDGQACAARAGKYQGADDLALVVALDIINGHGFADENTGDVAMNGYAWRVDRFIGIENSQGFVIAEEYPTAVQAIERLHDFDVPAEDAESDD
jgi:hypothetical protein